MGCDFVPVRGANEPICIDQGREDDAGRRCVTRCGEGCLDGPPLSDRSSQQGARRFEVKEANLQLKAFPFAAAFCDSLGGVELFEARGGVVLRDPDPNFGYEGRGTNLGS